MSLSQQSIIYLRIMVILYFFSRNNSAAKIWVMSNIFKKPIIPNIRFNRLFVLVKFKKINFYYFNPKITVNNRSKPNIRPNIRFWPIIQNFIFFRKNNRFYRLYRLFGFFNRKFGFDRLFSIFLFFRKNNRFYRIFEIIGRNRIFGRIFGKKTEYSV